MPKVSRRRKTWVEGKVGGAVEDVGREGELASSKTEEDRGELFFLPQSSSQRVKIT